ARLLLIILAPPLIFFLFSSHGANRGWGPRVRGWNEKLEPFFFQPLTPDPHPPHLRCRLRIVAVAVAMLHSVLKKANDCLLGLFQRSAKRAACCVTMAAPAKLFSDARDINIALRAQTGAIH